MAPGSPRPVDERRRWRKTEISFGLAGRLACTLLALTPVVRLVTTGSLWWLLVTVAASPLTVLWLADTWRKT